jgi:hypothetical protein
MKEIRICWRSDVIKHEEAERQHGGLWFPWTLERLATLRAIEEAGNEIFGSGSHWLEEREA